MLKFKTSMSENDEEYASACEDDDLVKKFNIREKIIDKINETTYLVKLLFRDLLKYTTPWCYNRVITQEKSDELYESLKNDYNMPWVLHAVYDEKISDDYVKTQILDGQHRRNAIQDYITEFDSDMTCDRCVWVWIYEIQNSETINLSHTIGLFKKINNNKQIDENDIPDQYIIDLIHFICKNKILKNGIGTKKLNNTCQIPCIHQKELNAIFNENKKVLCTMKYEVVLENLLKINNILSLKKYEDLYGKDKTQKKKYEKAVALKFYLNLGKKSKYPIEMLIKFVNNVEEL